MLVANPPWRSLRRLLGDVNVAFAKPSNSPRSQIVALLGRSFPAWIPDPLERLVSPDEASSRERFLDVGFDKKAGIGEAGAKHLLIAADHLVQMPAVAISHTDEIRRQKIAIWPSTTKYR